MTNSPQEGGPTPLRTLIQGATPGPWFTDPDKRQVRAPANGYPGTPLIIATTSYTHEHSQPFHNAQLIARMASPEVALKVLEALEHSENVLKDYVTDAENRGGSMNYGRSVIKRLVTVQRLLNALTPEDAP